MASKGVVYKKIVDSDKFLDMPATAQLLYFHLAINADKKGLVNNCKTILRYAGAKDSEIEILLNKNFIKYCNHSDDIFINGVGEVFNNGI